MSNVLFRDLSGMAEFRAAEDLQRQVWGDGDLPDPADLMMVIQAEGGLVGGAFADDRLVGYIFGFPTRDPQVQHSHRLAVLAQTRGMGLGVRLKLYQRDWCLARGISRVRWTFDPLRALNASLNIDRLGAQSDTYLENYYGDMGGINSGMGSEHHGWRVARLAHRVFLNGASRWTSPFLTTSSNWPQRDPCKLRACGLPFEAHCSLHLQKAAGSSALTGTPVSISWHGADRFHLLGARSLDSGQNPGVHILALSRATADSLRGEPPWRFESRLRRPLIMGGSAVPGLLPDLEHTGSPARTGLGCALKMGRGSPN